MNTLPLDDVLQLGQSISVDRIKKYFDAYVVGQEEVKDVIAQAFFLHFLRTSYRSFVNEHQQIPMKKSNALIMGPSGCGKSYIVSKLKRLCEEFNLYFYEINAKELTPSGYVGRSIDDYFREWAREEGTEKHLLENSIVFIDEVDKLISNAPTTSSNDFNKEIQCSILKALEGTTYYGMMRPTRANASSGNISTENITFILAGNFERIREDRKIKAKQTMGFTNTTAPYVKNYHRELITSGLITEITGRISLVGELHQLTEKQLYRALVDVDDSIYKQYKELFKFLGKRLHLSKRVLKEIVAECNKNGTGTRGLQAELDKATRKKVAKLDAQNLMQYAIMYEEVVDYETFMKGKDGKKYD